MKEMIKKTRSFDLPLRVVTFYDLISLTSKAFKSRLDSLESHNDYFKEELVSRRSWKFHAIKNYHKKYWGYALAKKIIWIFLDKLMHDLIYENDTFVLPYTSGGIILKVGDKPKPKHYDIPYSIEMRGHNYGEMIRYRSKGMMLRHLDVPYKVKFTQRFKKQIQEHIKIFDYD
jgi:hypothetical protein